MEPGPLAHEGMRAAGQSPAENLSSCDRDLRFVLAVAGVEVGGGYPQRPLCRCYTDGYDG